MKCQHEESKLGWEGANLIVWLCTKCGIATGWESTIGTKEVPE